MSELPLELVALVAGLAVAPFFLVLVTSFAKIAVVLGLLRYAIGVPQVPSNRIVTGLAIVLSVLVMAPVGEAAWAEIEPWVEQTAEQRETWDVATYLEIGADAVEPLRGFLVRHADPHELEEMAEIAAELRPAEDAEVSTSDLSVAIPAFVLTELTEAFTIGLLLFIPFVIIDLIVANILFTVGLTSMTPATVSLPFKLLLFVLVDGWYLVIRGLLMGYAT